MVGERDLFGEDGLSGQTADNSPETQGEQPHNGQPRLREAPMLMLGQTAAPVLPPTPPQRAASKRSNPQVAPAQGSPHASLEAAANDPTGHRARLRKRLLGGGAEALADHEILEYLLTTAIPRRDTKPLARTLLARFGSLGGVFNADTSALAAHPGMGETSAAAIHIVAVAARRFARTRAAEQPLLNSWQALLAYLTIDMAHLTVERVRVLYLDQKNRLIRDEHVADGSLDEAAIHPREVIRRAFDLGAAGLILVHNHPSGNPEPSRADIQITHRITEAGRLLDIALHDHVIIGREGHVSLRARGLI
jgi:DNA repair protein RadC